MNASLLALTLTAKQMRLDVTRDWTQQNLGNSISVTLRRLPDGRFTLTVRGRPEPETLSRILEAFGVAQGSEPTPGPQGALSFTWSEV